MVNNVFKEKIDFSRGKVKGGAVVEKKVYSNSKRNGKRKKRKKIIPDERERRKANQGEDIYYLEPGIYNTETLIKKNNGKNVFLYKRLVVDEEGYHFEDPE